MNLKKILLLLTTSVFLNNQAAEQAKPPTAPSGIMVDADKFAAFQAWQQQQSLQQSFRGQTAPRLPQQQLERPRSLSLDSRQDDSPAYTAIGTTVEDSTLQLGLEALRRMERNVAELIRKAREELQKRAQMHQQLTAGPIDATVKPRTGAFKVLNVLPGQGQIKRQERKLNEGTRRKAKLVTESGEAVNVLLAAILAANTKLVELEEKLDKRAEKSAAKHEKLQAGGSTA